MNQTLQEIFINDEMFVSRVFIDFFDQLRNNNQTIGNILEDLN